MDRLTCMNAFVKVVESGGFSAAARRLNASPQVVSNLIQVLESQLGVRLLNRTTRRVGLTDIGKTYYERCIQILSEIEDADEIVGALQAKPRGRLRLNVNTSLAPLIAPAIAEFLALYPEVSVDMTATDRMVDFVEEGYDLAIRNTPVPSPSHIVRRLTSYRFVVCGAPRYLKDRGTPTHPADLKHHNFLVFSPTPWGNDWLFKCPEGDTSIRICGNLQSNNGDALRVAAVCGHGLIVTPDFTVTDHLRSGRLIAILTEYSLPEVQISAIYPHRRYLSATVRSFIDIISKHGRDFPPDQPSAAAT